MHREAPPHEPCPSAEPTRLRRRRRSRWGRASALGLGLALALPAAAAAQTVEIGVAAAAAGERIPVAVSIAGEGVHHLQLEVGFDPAVLAPVAVTPSEAFADHLVDWNLVAPGVLRLVVWSPACPPPAAASLLRRQPSAAELGSGELLRIDWDLAPEAPAGTYPLTPGAAVLGDGDGGALSATLVPGSVEVVAGAAIAEIPTLDEWGLIGLALLLGGAAVRVLRRGLAAGIAAALVGLLVGQPLLAQMPLRTPPGEGNETLPATSGGQPAVAARTLAAATGGGLPGDANGDGSSTTADTAAVVDAILLRASPAGEADCNGDGLVDVLDVACTVAAVCAAGEPADNLPPTLAPIGAASLHEGEIYSVQPTVSDPDPGDVLTFRLLGAPVGMVVDPETGNVLWAPRGDQVGETTARLRVTDAAGLFAERELEVEVRALGGPPALQPIADRAVLAGTLLALTATAADPDLPGDELTFSLPLAPAGMTIDPASGAMAWSPGGGEVGAHDVTVQVEDREGLLDFTSFVATVEAVNQAPVARDEAYEARIGVPLVVGPAGVLANDGDPDDDPLAAVLRDDAAQGTLALAADGGFGYLLPPVDRTTPVELELQCAATRFRTNGTLAVGDLEGDGDVEIVGTGGLFGRSFVGEIWILNAADCSEQLATGASVEDEGGFLGEEQLGLLDVDGDGDLEIIGTRERFPFAEGGAFDRRHLHAFHHDGTLAWVSESSPLIDDGGQTNWEFAGPTFADLDADGTPEIVMAFSRGFGFNTFSGAVAYDAADGSLEWEFLSTFRQGDNNAVRVPQVADLDLDGKMEVIVHNSVLDHAGRLLFELPSEEAVGTHGPAQLALAIANFDDDPFPEIFGRDGKFHYLFEHDGTLAWRQEKGNNARSYLTAADFDGDGEVEVAYVDFPHGSSASFLAVYDTDGSLLWSHEDEPDLVIDSFFAARSNLTAFDANRDGAADLVMRNDPQDLLLVVDGRDGTVLDSVPAVDGSGTQRFVTVADVDRDGDAELIVSHSHLGGATEVWTGTAEHPLPAAPSHRSQWLFQEAYFEDDGELATNPVPPWLQPGRNGQYLVTPEPDPRVGTTDSFTYVAHDGALDSTPATVTLDILPAGNPPRFLSDPDTLTTRGFEYLYRPLVLDPDVGDTVTFQLTARPDGMTIDPATGEVRWRPETNGSFDVSILALDTLGFAVAQSYELVVGDPVVVPDVVGEPEPAAVGLLAAGDLVVGRRSSAPHPSIAAGAVAAQTPIAGSVAEFGGAVDLVVSLGPAPEDVDDDGDGLTENQGDCDDGAPAVHPGAADPGGDGVDQDCDGFDGSEPVIEIVVEPATLHLLAGETRQLAAYAVFADGSSQLATGLVAWASGNQPTATVTAGGRLNAVGDAGPATVSATRGAVAGTAQVAVTDRDAADDDAPEVEITSPSDGESVLGPVDVLGTAADPDLVRYELAISPAGEETWTAIGGGTAAVVNGALGELDPTLMLNGLYTLRLTVLDAGGNQAVDEATVQVEGHQKIGNFTLSFVDLAIPVSGIPITVTRSYDSRDKRRGDFGIGWRLGVETLDLSCTQPLGEDWYVARSGLVFALLPTRQHACSLVLADGEVEVFDFTPSPTASPIVPFPFGSIRAGFTPRPGTLGTLEALGDGVLSIVGPQPGPVSLRSGGAVYDPGRFRYTTVDGTEIVFGPAGVESLTDANGNRLTFEATGITHSTGRSITLARDALGRITAVTDPIGNTQTYRYSAAGDLVAHTDAAGNTTRFFYDADHGIVRIEDPLGRPVARNEYDADGRLIAQIDALGNRIVFAHDVDSRQEVVTDRLGNSTVMEYDERGNVTAVIDALGGRTENTYDAEGNLLTTTDPLGHTISLDYDASGNVTRRTDALGHSTTFTYDASGHLLTRTDAEGETLTLSYDSDGNLIARTDAAGNTQSLAHDAAGNLIAHTDGLGRTTRFAYDPSGFRTSRTDAAGHTETYTRDATGKVLTDRHLFASAAGPVEVQWGYGYDARGLLSSIAVPSVAAPVLADRDFSGEITGSTNPLGESWEMLKDAAGHIIGRSIPGQPTLETQYDAEGRRTWTVLPGGGVASRTLDALGRPIAEQLPATGAVTHTWDAAGRETSRTDALGNTVSFGYDAAGRRTAVSQPGGATTTFTYDGVGRVVATTDAEGGVLALRRDPLGRVVEVELPDGSTRSKVYDANGNVTSQTDARGLTWEMEHDPFGRLQTTSGPLGVASSYGYDSHGNLATITDANGHTASFVHDELGRLLRTVRPGGEVARCDFDALARPTSCVDFEGRGTTFVYDSDARRVDRISSEGTVSSSMDPDGRLIQVQDPRGTTTIARDDLGRITEWSGPSGPSVTADYDASGRLQSLATDAGSTSLGYNRRGAVTSVTDAGGTTSLGRDLDDRTTSIAWPNGIRLERRYDVAGRVERITYRSAADAVLLDLTYTRGPGGAIQGISTVSPSGKSDRAYSYDSLERLVREEVSSPSGPLRTTTYAYDLAGNLLDRTDPSAATNFTYDVNDQVTTRGDWTFDWDANGNLTSADDGATRETLTYDSRDRLIGFERTGADPVVVEYTYDHDGLLASRTANGVSTIFVWDRVGFGLPRLLEERTGSGELVRRYGYDGLFATHFVDASGDLTVLLTDHHGTVRGRAAGGVPSETEYDAFGRWSGTPPEGLGYIGGYTDPDSGLVFLRARWYAPELGRFIQIDPVAGIGSDPRTLHRYAYSLNDPVNRFDPSGTVEITVGQITATLAVAATVLAGYFVYDIGDPVGLVASGFGVKNVLDRGNLFDRDDARLLPLRAGLDLGKYVGLTAGVEFLDFFNLGRLAGYYNYGSEANTGGKSIASASASILPSVTNGVYNTPKPKSYEGYFVAVNASLSALPFADKLGDVAESLKALGVPVGAAFSFFWAPTVTYWVKPGGQLSVECPSCSPRYGHGYRVGFTGGLSASISLTYYQRLPAALESRILSYFVGSNVSGAPGSP